MSSYLEVSKTIELLNRLKTTISDFAAREERLNQEFRLKSTAARQQVEKVMYESARHLEAWLGQTDESYGAAKNRAEQRFQQRDARITEAGKACKKQLLLEAHRWEGDRKYRLQKDEMQAARDKEAGLATAEQEYEEFKAWLAEQEGVLTALEQETRASFRGYGAFLRLLSDAYSPNDADIAATLDQNKTTFDGLLNKAVNDLNRFKRRLLPLLFKYNLLWWLLLICLPFAFGFLNNLGVIWATYTNAGGALAICVTSALVLHAIGKHQSKPAAVSVAGDLTKARWLYANCLELSEKLHQQQLERIENEFQNRNQAVREQWDVVLREAGEMRDSSLKRIDAKQARIALKNETLLKLKLDRLEHDRNSASTHLETTVVAKNKEQTSFLAGTEATLSADYDSQWRELESEWKATMQSICESVAGANASVEKLFPSWQAPLWNRWEPPHQFAQAAKFARLEADLNGLSRAAPKDPRLAPMLPPAFTVPLVLTYPSEGSILFETLDTGHDMAIGALNNIILRLLSTAPPGRLSFTVVDPVGLGQNFAGVMHLSDYGEHLINSRIWTQTSQIEEKLCDLNEHMEKVIQMYLRNEYATIAEYNEQAGNIAEKYHFLVIADFPAGFSDTAAKRLLSIATSGARCGVYTLIHWDHRQPLPHDFVPDELRKNSVCISCSGNEFTFTDKHIPGTNLVLDPPPPTDFATQFVHKVGQLSRDSNRVEVPFSHISPEEPAIWTLDTTSELRVPIGRTGATKLQYLSIGKGTRQHALLAGKTGSGKSTLLHVIITNLSLWCSPEQVEFYLVDFKKGVEFKCYAAKRLPHARVVAIESDREFGLSVLQRVDQELRRRGELFRKLGVQDLPGYKKAGGTEPLPRSLLIIDEFQEFFVEDDKISQSASLLLDRIVRQGRAFGIHALLGSQTLGGAYSMARTTLGQMVIRIALQCNEADAFLIMDEDNPAPRLLSRPGEGIYNDAAGAIEGNSPFQAVWISDSERDKCLEAVRHRADRASWRHLAPFVYDGDAPADVQENGALQVLLESDMIKQTSSPRIWLGAPNSIKGPTEAAFRRQSGSHLLLVGQREEAALAILSVALVSLAAQYPPGRARFIVCDGTPPESPQREFLERILRAVPHEIRVVKNSDLQEVMASLGAEMKSRADDPHSADAPEVFFLVHELHKFSRLRYEEDFSFSSDDSGAVQKPGAVLNTLVCEGAGLGFHVIATCDSYNNVNRALSRKALTEFEMRVLFQMSPTDSASLIDTPKASTLGLHRGIFYNAQESNLEVFRPYALPGGEWIEFAAKNLARLHGRTNPA